MPTCEWCQKEFTPTGHSSKTPQRFCSQHCAGHWRNSQRPPAQYHQDYKPYKSVKLSGHPLADKSGCVAEHRLVLYKKIGPGKHKCNWCGREIEWQPGNHVHDNALTTDHLNNDTLDNDPDNLVPSCHRCNCKRGKKNSLKPGEPFVVRSGSKKRAVMQTCPVCHKEFPAIPSNHLTYCSPECAGKITGKTAPHALRPDEPFIVYGKTRFRAEHRICAMCSADFLAFPSSPKRFCSRSCFQQKRKGQPTGTR